MTNSIKYVLAFGSGIAVGVALSWNYFKTKYERIAQEEIGDVKDFYRNKYERVEVYEKSQYESITESYSTESSEVKVEDEKGPYVIAPEEFGDIEEYDTTSLYYYADGILTDLQDEVIEDVAGTVGEDFASHFGEYEDDSVCIRNDIHKCDYEILRDLRCYSDIKVPVRSNVAEE